ncbi:hypothetical protein T4D_3839 [Trichinella pseudospiralis]|uniref:Uncharacterized protein n=1 Tax=Trichinella pseudospiralis TaxID=6337 RepID=A0A0V1FW60_TRIPS|nr:hypothetical protein T4D_3839 [Trichinella pseudospiralis]
MLIHWKGEIWKNFELLLVSSEEGAMRTSKIDAPVTQKFTTNTDRYRNQKPSKQTVYWLSTFGEAKFYSSLYEIQ